MPSSIVITYNINPPDGIEVTAPASGTITKDAKSLRDAQTQLNDALTIWKDAIGDREKSKEDPGKIAHGQGKVARMMQDEDSD
jgi:hypothetical protein